MITPPSALRGRSAYSSTSDGPDKGFQVPFEWPLDDSVYLQPVQNDRSRSHHSHRHRSSSASMGHIDPERCPLHRLVCQFRSVAGLLS